MFTSGCTSLFLQPDHVVYFPPEKFGYSHEEIIFSSTDGTKLKAWHFPCTPCENPKGTILQFHGNAENLTSHYISLAWLTRYGYDLWIFDYRGYGQSEGQSDVHGSVLDSMAAIKMVLEKHKELHRPKFIVYAQSLGGALAMKALEELKESSEVDFLILDSTFASFQRVARQKLSDHVVTWLFSPLAYLLISDSESPKKDLDLLKMPKLVIHDKKDPVVSFTNGKLLFETLPEPKEIWEFEQGRHVGIFALDTIENRKRFLSRLDSLAKK